MYVVATAGHVDHGKSALIRALTGMEPDRWAEEKRRGMTIDLGYAWTVLPGGAEVAFVDVPGHQRFITSMLAGVGPVPAVLLVVAADEGWSRQTGEHLAALEALGVRHGVLALTRSDLGDAELALEEARDYLAESSLAGIEAVAVSSVTGAGLGELRAALERMVAGLPAPAASVSRLWVDRVFTIRGAGTVVTGTLGSGTIHVGDELQVSSSGEPVTVRSLETLKRPAEAVSGVARVALNLRRVKRAGIRRGDALVRAGEWLPVTSMDVRLVNTSEKPPQHPVLHVGSAARQVRLRSFDDDTARLSWDVPLPLRIGERAVLRNPGSQHVIAGVVVLDVLPPALARRGAARQRAAELAGMTGEPDTMAELARRGAAQRSALAAAGILGSSAPVVGAVSADDWLVDAGRWNAWQRQVREEVASWRSAHPLLIGMPAPALVQVLGLPDPALLTALLATVPGLVNDSDGVHPAEATATLPDAARAGLDKLRERLLADPFGAAEADDLRALGLDGRHLAIAVRSGQLIAVGPGIYLRPEAVGHAVELLHKLPQPFTLSDVRQVLGTTRRVALPLMELLDRQRLTRRVDASRRTLR